MLNFFGNGSKLVVMLRFIPNILTFGRLVLTVIFLIMLLYAPARYADGGLPFPDFLDVAFIIFVVAGLTDMIDGTIARRLGVTSKLGRIMDPLADKVLVCGAFICFAIIGEPKLFDISPVAMSAILWVVAGVIILRELGITILRHVAEAKGIAFGATFSGKIKMFLQSFAIGAVVMRMAHVQTAVWGQRFVAITYVVTIAVTVISGVRAIQRTDWKQLTD